MYKLELSKKEYELFKNTLAEFRPNIKIELIQCDEALERLGFCESAPCIIHVDLTKEDMETLIDELMQLEMDAFNTETGEDPLPNDPLYMLYKKFGWMWGYFYSAEWIED